MHVVVAFAHGLASSFGCTQPPVFAELTPADVLVSPLALEVLGLVDIDEVRLTGRAIRAMGFGDPAFARAEADEARAMAPYWRSRRRRLGRPCLRFALRNYRHTRRADVAPAVPAVVVAPADDYDVFGLPALISCLRM
jgi:hypothetical protein